MDAKHTASAGSEERPPLGSEEAIGKVAEAIFDRWGHEVREDRKDLGKQLQMSLRANEPVDWPYILHTLGYLDFKPHYLEVIKALHEFPEAAEVGTTPEDMFEEYVAGVRRREMEQRRKLAERRRRDAELLGLSAEESDRAEERRERLMEELEELEPRFLGFKPWPPSSDWQPDEVALAEGRRRYMRYLDRRTRWHQQRPDVHPPIESHDGNQMIRDFAWDFVCARRAVKIRGELRALGVENP
jgi:hypothetical protein